MPHESGPRKSPLLELGVSGLDFSSGQIHEEFLNPLRGFRQAQRVFREMENNDATIGASLRAIRLMLRQVNWSTKPASDQPEDIEAADFLESCTVDMSTSWDFVIDEALSMLPRGFAPLEIVYKRRHGRDQKNAARRSQFTDGRMGWRKLALRAQDTIWEWIIDEQGGLHGLVQSAPPFFHRRVIPIDRLLLFRPTAYKNNPEGLSILRTAYRAWTIKKRIEEYEGIGVERDLAGIPVAEIPAELFNSTDPDKKALFTLFKNLVTQIRANEQAGICWPLEYDENNNQLYKLSLLTTGGSRVFDTSKIIDRWDVAILKSMLTDFLALGHEKVGSFALADSKTAVFGYAIAAWLDSIADVFNRFAVPRLFALNPDFRVTELPQLVHDDIETPDLKSLGEYVKNGLDSGAIEPSDELSEFFARKGGWHKPGGGADVEGEEDDEGGSAHEDEPDEGDGENP